MPTSKFKKWIRKRKESLIRHFLNFEETLEDTKSGKRFIEMKLSITKISNSFEASIRKKYQEILTQVEMREAKKSDIRSLRHLYNISWSTATMPFNSITRATLLKAIQDPHFFFLIVSLSSVDVGFAILKLEGQNDEIGIIVGIGILSEYRKKGLGTALGIASWDFFRKRNVKEFRCKVFSENKIAYRFITGLGFEERDPTKGMFSLAF